MGNVSSRLRTSAGSFWKRYEGPTWVVATIIYGAWALLVWRHASIPWWLTIPLGAFIIAWHNSLQHETIHALARVPRPIRFALGFPPLGLAIPYAIYCRTHRKHHRDVWVTDPHEDPESYYHHDDVWRTYPGVVRAIYLFNQTLIGRLLVGPLLYFSRFLTREITRILAGDCSNVSDWAWHAVSVGVLLFWVSDVAGLPAWQYFWLMVYPGLCLGMLRSFYEHRYDQPIAHRTAIVESGFPFNLLFLNNNLHVIHHRSPALPWYRIPAVWRESRAEVLEHNGGFYFAGYARLAAEHAVRPAFVPTLPRRESTLPAARVRGRAAGVT